MKIVAVFSIKGGVGKTSAAVNLAARAAALGQRTLVWDLDPQGASSFYFRVKPKVKGGAKALVRGARGAAEAIRETDCPGLDLLPSDFSYRKLDLHLARDGRENRLSRILKPLADDYDLVLLDCPPSISPLSESIFRAASLLLVPVIPTTLAVRTYEQLQTFCAGRDFGRLAIIPFLSMVDRRKTLHRTIAADFPAREPATLPTVIPFSSIVERMGSARAPIFSFAPKSAPAIAFAALYEDLRDALAR
ncbi:MAG: AAA family ATPase [Rhodothalassiaceae bacterium]